MTSARPPSPQRQRRGNFPAHGFGQFGSIGNNGGAPRLGSSRPAAARSAPIWSAPADSLLRVAAGGGQSSVSLNTNPENGTISFVEFGAYGAQALGSGVTLDGAAIYAHDLYGRQPRHLPAGHQPQRDVEPWRRRHRARCRAEPALCLRRVAADPARGPVVFPHRPVGLQRKAAPAASIWRSRRARSTRCSAGRRRRFAQPLDARRRPPSLPELRAAWLHNFLDTQSQYNASFIGTGAGSFAQAGVPIGREAGDLGAGISFAIAQTTFPAQMSGFVQYDATLASHETANTVAAGLLLKW